jgi:3-oxoacyl-[acyl-carrier-protein] synthase II
VTRVEVFGWGIVAPGASDIAAFARLLERGHTALDRFDGFGPDNFRVGRPDLTFEDYRPWIEARFSPARYDQLATRMGRPTQYAVAAFIQALAQNPGLEATLQALGAQAHVYVGSGLGDLHTTIRVSREIERAQRIWNRFWARPERNAALRRYLDDGTLPAPDAAVPHRRDGSDVDEETRRDADDAWSAFWARHSVELEQYLEELARIERADVGSPVEVAKLVTMRQRRVAAEELQRRWNAPPPPWKTRSSEVLWNIHNGPAAQISMLGKITGLSFAPVAACSSFGVALHLALRAIRAGEARAVVVGAADLPPEPAVVAGFHDAHVTPADADISEPLTGLRGTHVAGGATIWIVGDADYLRAQGYRPLGMEPLAVGVSSDAEHIITPSARGPHAAIRQALAEARVAPDDVACWDLHATATPGDVNEVQMLRAILPESALLTARKGLFGHGMSASGGWELTAQYLSYAAGRIHPTSLAASRLHPDIAKVHQRFAFEAPQPAPGKIAGKLSMGVGGVNACVISRRIEDPGPG